MTMAQPGEVAIRERGGSRRKDSLPGASRVDGQDAPGFSVLTMFYPPPMDYSWGPTWNTDVLSPCGQSIDWVSVHWYTSRNVASLLRAPARRMPEMAAELENTLALYRAPEANRVEWAATELGPNFVVSAEQAQATGLFTPSPACCSCLAIDRLLAARAMTPMHARVSARTGFTELCTGPLADRPHSSEPRPLA